MAGCHEVVWPVGSSRRGKAPVEAFGPGPGTTGIPCGPPMVPEVAAGAWGAGAIAGGATVPVEGDSIGWPVGGVEGVVEARGISGIGFSEGEGVVAGVGARMGGWTGWGWVPACGSVGMKAPDCGVIGCW